MIESNRRQRQTGLTLVELMVGITVGLIVTAGASLMAVNQISEHRRITVEVQLQQDLRLIADLVTQEIRRAGFRGWPELGVWAPESAAPSAAPAATPSENPFETLKVSDDGSELTYSFESAPLGGTTRSSKTPIDDFGDADQFGFKIEDGELKMQLGKGNWQPLSDKGSYTFDPAKSKIQILDQPTSLEDYCDRPCAGAKDCPPQQEVRTVVVTLVATSTILRDVTRSIRLSERIRSDKVTGTCAK